MGRKSKEFIVFINKKGEGIIIEGDYEWEYGEFKVRDTVTIDESLLESDGYGLTSRVDMEKAFKPLKFYRVKWWEEVESTPGDTYYTSILEELEEVDYINQ